MAKKIFKIIGVGISILFFTALLMIAGIVYVTEYRITDIDASDSPGGEYKVLFQSVGEADFPFGDSHARLVLKKGRRTISKHKFDVANDGKTLTASNWDVCWDDTCVRITVYGEEQDDLVVTMYYDGDVQTNDKDEIADPEPDYSAVDFSLLAEDNDSGKSVFSMSIERFIDVYNSEYRRKFGESYLTKIDNDKWYCYDEPSPRFGYNAVKCRFSSDPAVWSIPTMSVYVNDNDEIYEIRTTFDDHSYQESLFCEFRDMSLCLLSAACRDLSDEEIDKLFGDLYDLSESNFFGNNNSFGDPDRPPLTAIYRCGKVGFYSFYGSGSVEICMLPLTPGAEEKLTADGTDIIDIGG